MIVRCPNCKWRIEVQDERIPIEGRKGTCPECQTKFEVKRNISPIIEQPPSTQKDTRPCPLCGEAILTVAKKCKHCQSMLEEEKEEELPLKYQTRSKSNGNDPELLKLDKTPSRKLLRSKKLIIVLSVVCLSVLIIFGAYFRQQRILEEAKQAEIEKQKAVQAEKAKKETERRALIADAQAKIVTTPIPVELKIAHLWTYKGELTGIIWNLTDKQIDHVRVVFNLYDKNNMQIGSTAVRINNFDPHGSYKYNLSISDEVTDAKIVFVDGTNNRPIKWEIYKKL